MSNLKPSFVAMLISRQKTLFLILLDNIMQQSNANEHYLLRVCSPIVSQKRFKAKVTNLIPQQGTSISRTFFDTRWQNTNEKRK